MTEEEWLRERDLFALANFLRTRHHLNRTKAGRRKFRLLGCAFCRHAWPLFANAPKHSQLVLEAEKFADGDGSQRLLDRLAAALPIGGGSGLHTGRELGFRVYRYDAVRMVASSDVIIAAVAVADIVASGTRHVASGSGVPVLSEEQQVALFRDIFGNPFRPAAFDPAWRTSTAVALAQQMYDSRDFGLMPILGDALQDAGCDSADILDHCRGDGPHVRGCWVVDLVLGKT